MSFEVTCLAIYQYLFLGDLLFSSPLSGDCKIRKVSQVKKLFLFY